MDLTYDPPAAFRHAIDQLHETVTAETGLTDFGSADYLAGLTTLLQSMDYDPQFSETGRRAAWGMVIGVLRGRAQAIASMKANPAFAAAPLLAPVVITGVPRTGTTALHRLLAVDPRFQGLQTWLLDSPMPRPPIETWGDYPEFRKSAGLLETQYAAAPGSMAAHFRAAEEVHEDCMIMRQSFVSNLWSCGWSAASYDAWWQCQSEANAYDHLRRCVQLIGMNEPDKRWLLKNPGHIEHLDLLFAVFPDARVIQTHRDPAKAVPSLVSLLMNLNALMEPERTQQRAEILLRREVAKWANAVRKAEAVKARHPGQVLDLVHADFHARPMKTVEAIYRFINMDIPAESRAALAQRIEEKPELARGEHRYSIADYGMTMDEARAPFAEYIERYDLLEKKA